MEGRRTPNEFKGRGLHPTSAGSSKFARPRSHRKLDANSTIILGSNNHNFSMIGSSSNLNQTVRRNLDTTISGPCNPRVQSSIGTLANDMELEYDLAYNEYLQALIKEQLVKKTIEQHKDKLGDQILIQCKQLYKLESIFGNISNEIDNFRLQSEIVEVLDVLNNSIQVVENLCEKYNTRTHLQQLSSILLNESKLVSARNIKPISSQEEYDELLTTLNNLSVMLEKFQNSGRGFEEVNKLAVSINNFNELRSRVEETSKKVCDVKKRTASTFIKQGSDMLAEQGGYF